MPILYQDVVRGSPRNALTIPSPREDVLRETFAQAYEENPLKAYQRWRELKDAEGEGPMLAADTARAKLKEAGMERDLTVSDAGITQAALDTLMWRKKIERRRQETFARSEGGFTEGAQRLGVAIATTLSDPISMGLNFVPVVGQVRYARWLSRAGSLAARMGVRAGVGALEGATGAALAEPFIYEMRTQEQADYDSTDSLMNVAFGGLVGAGLHTTVGTAGELINARLGMSQIPRGAELDVAERVIERRLASRIGGNLQSAIEEYNGLAGADGGRIINTDLARELSPEYRADRTRSAAVHEPASYLAKKIYERKLAEAPKEGEDALVVFSAGGTGAGKTTGMEVLVKADPRVARAQIIYDTNMNTLKSSVQKIEQALAADKAVRVVYVLRDPVDALVKGALPRAMRTGRTVPIEEHARTHVGSADVIRGLAERYRGDERVHVDVVDNTHGKGQARIGQIADVRDLDYNRVREELYQALEAQRASGAISEAVYRGTAGKAYLRSRTGGSLREGPQQRDGEVLNTPELLDQTSSEVRQAALRAAVGQAVSGDSINVAPILSEALPENVQRQLTSSDTEYRAAAKAADESLARDIPSTSEANLKAAEEEADLAIAEGKAIAERLGLKFDHPDINAVNEAVERGERWARAAELATVCLTRGG